VAKAFSWLTKASGGLAGSVETGIERRSKRVGVDS